MSSFQSAAIIIMAEVIIMLLIAIGYLAFRYMRNNRDVMTSIQTLANKISCNKDNRINVLNDFLTNTCHYDEASATKAAEELIENERLFYNCLMNVYINRDNATLAILDTKTEEVINAYRNLLTESVKAIEAESEQSMETKTQQLNNTIDKLNVKNKKLDVEVSNLNKDMDATIEEYSSAFHEAPKIEGSAEETATATTATKNDTPPPANSHKAMAEPEKIEPTKKDEFLEPEFHNRGINDPVENIAIPETDTAQETTAENLTATTDSLEKNTESTTAPETQNDQETDSAVNIDDLKDVGDHDDDNSNQAVNDDLEAMAALLDEESEKEALNPDILLDGLDADDEAISKKAD